MISFDVEQMNKKGRVKLKISTERRVNAEVKTFNNLDKLKPYLIKKINLLEIR